MMKAYGSSVALALSALWLAACQLSGDGAEVGAEDDDGASAEVAQAATVPARGSATTLDIGSWNLEWFGDTSNGPSNETLQLSNVRDVMGGTDFDIWGLEEVVSVPQFNSLVSQLPGYAGFVANDPFVVNGAAFYSDFSNQEQKVGIVYKTSIVSVQSAQVILTQNDSDFAGRPPLEVKLRASLNGVTQDMVVIVIHAKCCTDSTSYQRRVNASNALKAYLDATYPTQKVWVIGDWNDDVDTSISSGLASPYQNFVSDPARYTIQTKVLSDAGIASTTSFPDMIDHHMNTNDAAATYVAGSAEVYRVDSFISGYGTTTSDHFPVLTRYTLSGGGTTTPTVIVASPNGGESFAAGSTQNITWSSSGITSLKLEYSLDGGGSWTTITSSTPASAGSFAWTVPSVASTNARVRATDTASAASDTSDASFTITTGGGTAKVILNEILANEPGGNTAAEFVEIVNIGTASADLSGWTLSDSISVRHTFAGGTTLASGKAIVVFAGASAIPAGLTNAVAASSGALGLNNSGDTVTLRSSSSTVETFTYPSSLASQDGVSMNRNPDGGSALTFVLHNTLSAKSSSPGTRVDGTPW